MTNLTEGTSVGAGAFLQTLKRSTSALHELLESNKLLSAILKPGVTVQQYYCYLFLMKKVAEVYEAEVLPISAKALGGLGYKRASELIAEDLQVIGNQIPAGVKSEDFDLIKEITLPFALGFTYVMEGSKLGGKVIFKHIQGVLGFSESNGAKFIADYGSNTGKYWREFLSLFSEYIVYENKEEEAIQGANYAFTSIYRFFETNRSVYGV